jgi:superfamily II DNA/RNA helicase
MWALISFSAFLHKYSIPENFPREHRAASSFPPTIERKQDTPRILVFCATKRACGYLGIAFQQWGIPSDAIHGDGATTP